MSAANMKFTLKPVVAALALAMAAGSAHAAPTPNQMPGGGQVAAVSLGSAIVVGLPIVNIPNGATGTVDGKVVIRWGVNGIGEVTNPLGFNLGSNATISFSSSVANGSVLNIDVSGNSSQIFGNLLATNTGGFVPSLFVANANGIVVGAGGRIVAPAGVGLIGANLDNATSINDFIGNNGWVIPAAPAYGNSFISFGTVPTTGNVTIAGAINGDAVLNLPAQYIFVAGNNIDVLNTGNLFGTAVVIEAGLVASPKLAAVGGLSNQTVNRICNVDAARRRLLPCSTTAPGTSTLPPARPAT